MTSGITLKHLRMFLETIRQQPSHKNMVHPSGSQFRFNVHRNCVTSNNITIAVAFEIH